MMQLMIGDVGLLQMFLAPRHLVRLIHVSLMEKSKMAALHQHAVCSHPAQKRTRTASCPLRIACSDNGGCDFCVLGVCFETRRSKLLVLIVRSARRLIVNTTDEEQQQFGSEVLSVNVHTEHTM